MAIQLFNQIRDFPGSNAFSVESDDRCFKVICSAGIIRNQLLIEAAITITRNVKVKLTILGIQYTSIESVAAVAGAVAIDTVFLITKEFCQFDL